MSAPTVAGAHQGDLTLDDIERCFEGVVPAVVATASADGVPNVTYLSRVRSVGPERVALSNQFFSKTARNLTENPRASLLLIDPVTFDEYRLALVYERTERRGPVFDRLRTDIDLIASLTGMEGVFRLRAADIYRVLSIDLLPRGGSGRPEATACRHRSDVAAVGELVACLSRCGDLDALVEATVAGLDRVLGHRHSVLFLLDDDGRRLVTLASHGYPTEGVGSELLVGDGIAGAAAERAAPVRVGNLLQLDKYGRSVRRSIEGREHGRHIELPDVSGAQSRLAVPAMAGGQVAGVLMVESTDATAYGADDEAALSLVAAVVAQAVEAERAASDAVETQPTDEARGNGVGRPPATTDRSLLTEAPAGASLCVRFFPADGSTFLDGEYLIKGVAGRILWSLLRQHVEDGRTDFTNREVRLDPSLELPPFKDNFESRLLLLKRRLDEHDAALRVERTGRGRFRLRTERPVELELGGT